ncbi:MAG: hypothetical protein FDW93_05995 [Bergeyella sp.]|nr:hypothetical protein [Bergeyella sp.]
MVKKNKVNFSEDYELNYHLKKHNLSQSKENRAVLVSLGKGFREKYGKDTLTHEEVDVLIAKNSKEFKIFKK